MEKLGAREVAEMLYALRDFYRSAQYMASATGHPEASLLHETNANRASYAATCLWERKGIL